MSGTLKALRGELIDTITQLTTYDHVPARVNLPCAFIMAGSPYIAAGDTFGERQIRFGVVILTAPSLNSIETDELDAWIEDIQAALEGAGWLVESTDQPRIESLGEQQDVLATTINVATYATFD